MPSFDRPLRLSPSRRVPTRIGALAPPHTPSSSRIGLTPDARGLDRLGVETSLRLGVLPFTPAGAITPIGTPDKQAFRNAQALLERRLGPVAHVETDMAEIEHQITRLRDQTLAARAVTRTSQKESCRSWSSRMIAALTFCIAVTLVALSVLWPFLLVVLLTAWATVTLLAVTGLRTVAALVEARHARKLAREWSSSRTRHTPDEDLPVMSILVPLFDEEDIAEHLISRLQTLKYPRSRLEVLLILEASDVKTQSLLDRTALPDWMRIVTVPAGAIRTKPRAMNYALDFARGDLIGIYDAEDKPATDQLLKVTDAFRKSGPEVACVQGVLDFYNPAQSWLTRCFAIDYATWFRLVLPGLVRMGFVIPLGGTTVFFRRDVLDKLGRWDAHNVTEDADLGIRLARRGYRVTFVPTITEEEATASVTAWLRQRSRWIKGYAVTWAVHMRDPLRLLGELGLKRFLGLQILFLGTLSQFILAPLLWSFWLVLFGLPHPVTDILPWGIVVTLGGLFLLSEVATLGIAALSVAAPSRRWLIKWVPMMHLYFPLAAIASWKGFAELIYKPFYWDKTAHGKAPTPPQEDRAARPLPHPA